MLYSDESNIKHSVKYFLVTLGVIVLAGLLMVYSSSFLYSKETHGSSSYYFLKQLFFIFIGLIVFFTVYKTKISFWINYIEYLMFFFIIMLVLTFVPVLGVKVKGAYRWINLYFLNFQPAEFFKYILIIFAAKFFVNFNLFKKSLVHYTLLLSPFVLLVLQPDFGTLVICFSVCIFVAYFSNLDKKIFYGSIAIGFGLLVCVLIAKPYRVQRLMTYLDPWKNEQGSGFQIIQSFLAFSNGGIFGKGLGNSQEKLFYLPEAHNDFIFSVIGEELGFVGVVLFLFAFLIFCFYGFKIASKLKNNMNKIIVVSLVFTIVLQAILNISVTMGLIPTKGLALPFVSAGGSSVIANFFAIGLIMSCSRSEINDLFKNSDVLNESL